MPLSSDENKIIICPYIFDITLTTKMRVGCILVSACLCVCLLLGLLHLCQLRNDYSSRSILSIFSINNNQYICRKCVACYIFFRNYNFSDFFKFGILLAKSFPLCNISPIKSFQFFFPTNTTWRCVTKRKGVSRVSFSFQNPKFEFFPNYSNLKFVREIGSAP